MIPSIALVLAFLVPAQDPEILELIDKLSAPDPAVRMEAENRLIDIGMPARPALLKSVKDATAEVRHRSRSILGEIELSTVFAGGWRISVPAGTYTLAQVADRVREATGVTLEIPTSLRGRRVTIPGGRMLLWDFLETVCVADGSLDLAPRPTGETLGLVEGTPSRAPSTAWGPFRIWIPELGLERRNPYGPEWKHGSLRLAISWQPNVRLAGSRAAFFELDEVVADDGTVLEIDPRMKTLQSGSILAPGHARTYSWRFRFAHPPDASTSLKRIRGTAIVGLPLKKETIRIDAPARQAGDRRRAGVVEVVIREWKRENDVTLAKVTVSAPGRGIAGSREVVTIRDRVRPDGIRILGADDRETALRLLSSRTHFNSGRELWDVELEFASKGPVKALLVEAVTDHEERRIPFVLGDVTLP